MDNEMQLLIDKEQRSLRWVLQIPTVKMVNNRG